MIKLPTLWPQKQSIDNASNYLIENKSYGFFDGGCLIFAQAVKLLIPNCEIVTILRKKHPDHYGVYITNDLNANNLSGLWGDASGLYENQYFWAQKFSFLEKVSGKLEIKKELIKTDAIPKDIEISKRIAEILSN